MNNPFEVLGLGEDADEAAIRARYLELIRTFSPEHHADKFARIREAYEQLKDPDKRLATRLFAGGKGETLNALVEELECRSPRDRVPLRTLLSLLKN